MQPFWEENVYVVVVESNNYVKITYKVKPEKETNAKICALHKSMLLPSENLLDSFNWSMKAESNHSKKHNKKTVERQPLKKNNNKEEGSATRKESNDVETKNDGVYPRGNPNV